VIETLQIPVEDSMKIFIGLAFFSLSFGLLANADDSRTFVYDGSEDSKEFVIKTAKFHTEERKEEVINTCYKEVVAGHRSICSGTSMPGAYYPGPYYPGPRRASGAYFGQCYSEPFYRKVPYSCKGEARTPFQVQDYQIEARFLVDVINLSGLSSSGETFTVSLEKEIPLFRANGSKKFFIIKKNEKIKSQMTGSLKMIDVQYVAELIEASPFLASVKMNSVEVLDSTLKVKLSASPFQKNIGFSVKVVQNKLTSDKNIFEKELLENEFVITESSEAVEASVDLRKLGLSLNDGKFSITVKAIPKFDGSLLNFSQFYELYPSKTIVYKVR
jgi:hypothetical protein